MRLIDADKLIFEGQKYNKGQMKAILDFVDAQPTIYDIDKVVEELELHSFEMGTDTLPAHYVRLNKAIEIVKQGDMTNFEKIKSMTEEEFANWLCKCIIPEDTDEDMFLCEYGNFIYEEDIVKMLKEKCD